MAFCFGVVLSTSQYVAVRYVFFFVCVYSCIMCFLLMLGSISLGFVLPSQPQTKDQNKSNRSRSIYLQII